MVEITEKEADEIRDILLCFNNANLYKGGYDDCFQIDKVCGYLNKTVKKEKIEKVYVTMSWEESSCAEGCSDLHVLNIYKKEADAKKASDKIYAGFYDEFILK